MEFDMKKVLVSVFLILPLALMSFANGPVNPALADGEGVYDFTKPHLSPWGLDDVSWNATTPAIQAFRRAASGVLGDYFYTFGSQTAPLAMAFNLTTQQWSMSTSPLSGNCNWHGVATNDAIYIVGWYAGSYGNQVQRFTPTGGGPTGTWAYMANYPASLCGIAAAWDGGDFIYAAGGDAAALNAYKYSISGNVWTPIANMPSPQRYCGGAFVQGKFYCVGGYQSPTVMNCYDPASNSWTVAAPIPGGTTYFTTFSTTFNDNYVIIIGGAGQGGTWPPSNQVLLYDPLTNTWMNETPLPEAVGVQPARYYGVGNAISAGGNNGSVDVTITNLGVNFPGGEPPIPLDMEVILTPVGLPITLPASGGTLEFNIEVTNNEPTTSNANVWTMVTLPNGSEYGPLINVFMGFAPNFNGSRDRFQAVPASAPSGNYTYDSYVGIYPNFIWDEDHFEFSKSATDNGGPIFSEWEHWGESFDEITGISESYSPDNFTLHGAYPNPFNPTTSIEYDLVESVSVHLAVYDISGRLVATLVDGVMPAGAHVATMNGTNLSSGVYLVNMTAGHYNASTKVVLMK